MLPRKLLLLSFFLSLSLSLLLLPFLKEWEWSSLFDLYHAFQLKNKKKRRRKWISSSSSRRRRRRKRDTTKYWFTFCKLNMHSLTYEGMQCKNKIFIAITFLSMRKKGNYNWMKWTESHTRHTTTSTSTTTVVATTNMSKLVSQTKLGFPIWNLTKMNGTNNQSVNQSTTAYSAR